MTPPLRPQQPTLLPPPARPGMRRRDGLQAGALLLLFGAHLRAQASQVVGVRVWPAPDYSRVTIESDSLLRAQWLALSDPPRLAVDIEGLEMQASLGELVAKIQHQDPNIASVRVGQWRPSVVRLVIDLKQAVWPQMFNLPPLAAYQHRLVIDLYPQQAPDPLEALLRPAPPLNQSAEVRAAQLLGRPLPPAADPLGDLVAQHTEATTSVRSPPSGGGARPAAPSGAGRSNAMAERSDRLIVVAIDPGHGGEDPGAIGPAGTQEKDVVLQIGRLLRDRINQTEVNGHRLRAFMTRDGDFFVPLYTRVQKAERVKADLMISIHADAFYTPNPQGASVYALSTSGASSAGARWMAKKENDADLIGGAFGRQQDPLLQRSLLDMSHSAQIKDSLKLGEKLLGEMGRVGRLHKPRVEQAGFAVLKAPEIPSVLVESAFISNPEEEQRLIDPAYQSNLADALLRGVVRYFSLHPPLARRRQA